MLRLSPTNASRGQSCLVPVFFEELFRVQRGHAARTGRGDRLAITVILHVPGNEDSGNLRQAAVRRDEIAVRIHIEFRLEDLAVRIMADRDEHSLNRDFARLADVGILHAHAFDRTFLLNVGSITAGTTNSIFSFAFARSIMIFEARNSARR